MVGGKPDTSPKIAEYDKSWGIAYGTINDTIGWCITEWYDFNPPSSGATVFTLCGYVGNDANQRTFQYYGYRNSVLSTNWYYFNANNAPGTRNIGMIKEPNWEHISFSLDSTQLENLYVYVQETGQIIFAGKNTPYYGYKNINDMPTA